MQHASRVFGRSLPLPVLMLSSSPAKRVCRQACFQDGARSPKAKALTGQRTPKLTELARDAGLKLQPLSNFTHEVKRTANVDDLSSSVCYSNRGLYC